ncbi:long-chain fatty acid transport protein [Aeromonas sp. RU39B]|uniref:outer membrane protein transport protein n=1 Tax=Aeromonas sp. RU39B TaxID=1907416 RepID=UPI000954A3B1|nr:outer membrane protein transport protein [Aeromonas sp. RU39B]SIQ25958.1 long-chain fatty acid transport protein [Aeromonas sp. RU39B]
MKSIFRLSILTTALFASHAMAAGYQLAEQSATGLGRAFAGEAAIADNASVLGRNVAAITRFEHTALSVGAVYIKPDVNIKGTTVVGGHTLNADARDIADDAWVPNLYLVTPINDRLSMGFGATSYYGLGVEMPSNYNAGHFGNVSDIKTYDLGLALAYQLTPWLSAGMGISAIRGEGEVGGTYPSGNLIAKHLEGDGWAMGWNTGILISPSEKTRIGISYRNGVDLKLKGDAKLGQKIGSTYVGLEDTGELILPLPATAELALYHQLTPSFAMHASINWTDWSKFTQLEAKLDRYNTMHIKDENWEDNWRYAIGMTYQLTPLWQLRSGIAYDRSPVSAEHRTISIPDADRIWYSAGVGYQVTPQLNLDLGLTFIDGKKVPVHENLSTLSSTFDGTSEGDAWLAGLQASYTF